MLKIHQINITNMKKLIICLSFIALFSCSKEDMHYYVMLYANCPNNGTNQISYCVNESTYNRVKSDTKDLGPGCKNISFDDIDGTRQSGYYTGLSSGPGACD